jgi:hypothetical protein
MATTGQLQPGWSGTYWFPLGTTRTGTPNPGIDAGNGILSITMRAKAGRLILSWHSHTTIMSGNETGVDVELGAGANANEEEGTDAELGDVTKIVIPVELVRHFDGSYRFYFRCPGREAADASTDTSTDTSTDSEADGETDGGDAPNAEIDDARRACGRRVLKLHFVHLRTPGVSSGTGDGRYRFLCRHCGGLVYAGTLVRAGQRALRRANKLWQRLAGAEEAAEAAQLIAEALQAETRAAEVHTAQLQRLIAWLDNRRDPEFTL